MENKKVRKHSLCGYTGGFGDASWSRMLSYQKD